MVLHQINLPHTRIIVPRWHFSAQPCDPVAVQGGGQRQLSSYVAAPERYKVTKLRF
jgi:hypothetical protein